MKTIKFFTLGCKVNQYETQEMRESFIGAGFRELGDSQAANTYLINTCTVTHRADSESLSLMRRAKRENPKAKIIITGCLTELDEDKIIEVEKNSFIVKNKDKEKILNGVSGISYFKNHTRAFLKIQDGCNNFCSYCKVPLVRGKSRSKPLIEIIKEADRLVKNGYKEIVLTGICLGAYGKDLDKKITLVEVIEALEKIEGLLRIRLSSIEAKDITDELINKLHTSKKLCKHLHIPIQSGDDEILKKMNRKITRDDYLRLIKNIKKTIPEIAITTDVLVGFPGENEEQFQNTIDLVQEIKPLKVHIFPYSKRIGTAAATSFNGRISPLVIKKRMKKLESVGNRLALNYKRRFLNRKFDVLIEDRFKQAQDLWQGYTDNYLKVLIRSKKDIQNNLIPLKLKMIAEASLWGEEIN